MFKPQVMIGSKHKFKVLSIILKEIWIKKGLMKENIINNGL